MYWYRWSILNDIKELIDIVPTWKKWLGTGVGGVLLFFIILLVFTGPIQTKEVAEIPIELKETQTNLTKNYIEETKGPVGTIIGSFADAGELMSKDMSDPALGGIIKFLWLLLGIIIAGAIVIIPVIAIYRAFNKVL